MNISVIQKIIDEMGGLYFHIPADMYYYDYGVIRYRRLRSRLGIDNRI